MTRSYESPEAFRQALEQRLRTAASTGPGLVRRRQRLVFDRFLARSFAAFGEAVTLKGGLALELRLERARTTKDIDLRLEGSPDALLAQLQAAARMDLQDCMAFEVGADPVHPIIEGKALRFRAECRLAGRLYGQPFGVDVGFGDAMTAEPEIVLAEDVLAFAGIAPPKLRIYPIETHVAEKLHAYTLPRSRPNSRVKDLPDLALLGSVRQLRSASLRTALEQTFDCRQAHALPPDLPDPPPSWASVYAAMAREDQLPWATIDVVTAAARAFLGPVLAGALDLEWQPGSWSWST